MYERVQAEMGQLPRGRHRIPREEVLDSQRRRLLAGIAKALAEEGFARLTVEHVVTAAGVSRKTFYEHFESREECLLAAYDAASEALWGMGEEAASAGGQEPAPAGGQEPASTDRLSVAGPARVRAALGALLDFLAVDPARAHLFTVEARAAGEPMAARQRADVERAAALLTRAGEEDAGARAGEKDADPVVEEGASAEAEEPLPEATATTLVENVAAVVGANILSGATEILPAQAPQLTEYLLAPYIGAERAREAADLESPPASESTTVERAA